MVRAPVYRSDRLRSVHRAMEGIHRVGGIDQATMRRFDLARLTLVAELEPAVVERKRRRRRE